METVLVRNSCMIVAAMSQLLSQCVDRNIANLVRARLLHLATAAITIEARVQS